MFCTSVMLREAGVVHGCSERTGGVSEGRYESLNLSDKWGDAPDRVTENLRRFASAVGFRPETLVTARQVHGVEVVRAEEVDAHTEADGVWTTRGAGLVVGVRTADCVPILLLDDSAGVCAAVHSGWRGTVGNIARVAVETLVGSGAATTGLRAVIGPCIGVDAFEVGEEVAAQFDPRHVRSPGEGRARPHVDLRRCVRDQLVASGVPDAQIEDLGGCTHGQPARFFSYRRDGAGIGQLLSVIGWSSPQP